MAKVRRKFVKGIRLKETNVEAGTGAEDLSLQGEIAVDASDNELKVRLDSATRTVVTEDQVQTVTNKTIDVDNNTVSNIEVDNLKVGVLNTDLSGAATDAEIPSALAVKNALAGQNDAAEIDYDNAASGLTAVNVQAAIDEVEARVDTAESDITELEANQADLIALSGVAENSTNLGTFTGNTISDSVTNKVALQELETSLELKANSDGATISNATITGASIQTPSRLDVKQDTEANLETYATTAADGQIVFATDTQKMYQIIDNELQAIGGGGSTSFEIAQVAHGFAVGNGIYHNGTTYVQAQANDAETLAYHVVVAVVSPDIFIAADFGRIEAIAHGYTVGQYYYQSEATAGLAVSTEPVSGFSNPLFYVESANILQVKCLRPSPVGDIFSTVDQAVNNNQAAAQNIGGLIVDGTVTRSAVFKYSIYRVSSLEEYTQTGQLRVTYKTVADSYSISDDFAGDDSGVTFSVDSTGQIQYTSTNLSGTGYSGNLKIKTTDLFDV